MFSASSRVFCSSSSVVPRYAFAKPRSHTLAGRKVNNQPQSMLVKTLSAIYINVFIVSMGGGGILGGLYGIDVFKDDKSDAAKIISGIPGARTAYINAGAACGAALGAIGFGALALFPPVSYPLAGYVCYRYIKEESKCDTRV